MQRSPGLPTFVGNPGVRIKCAPATLKGCADVGIDVLRNPFRVHVISSVTQGWPPRGAGVGQPWAALHNPLRGCRSNWSTRMTFRGREEIEHFGSEIRER